MSLTRLALVTGLLAAAPLLSQAQSTDFAPRYYVGFSLYNSDYQPASVSAYNNGNGLTVPVQLTVGYQLRPRLAVQLGVAYAGDSYSYSNTSKYYSTPTNPAPAYYFAYTNAGTFRSVSETLLARYTLTRQLAHRVQFDALGGVTLVHRRYHYTGTRTDTDSTQAIVRTEQYDTQDNTTSFLLTAGVSTRCRVSRHLEAVFDFMLNQNLGPVRSFNPGSAAALGLRYRFGG